MGSLFAGIGGFDLGFERAGFDVKWQVELDPWCRKVLAKHFPNAERFDDVRTVGQHNLKRVDVISAGFPCQDISNAGKRAGIAGKRSGLWSETCRILSELRPDIAMLENVGALLSPADRITWIEPAPIATVLGDLAEIGYDAEWDIVSAADMGAPHLRERVWIVAYPMSLGCLQSRFAIESAQDEEWDHSPYWEDGKAIPSEVRTSGKSSIFANHRKERAGFFQETLSAIGAFSWCKDVRRVEDLRGRPDLPEPLFRGSRDGVPHWVDRVGGLGNAVIPQIPEMYAVRIAELLK